MTKTVGAYEAKTHFSQLLEEVQSGTEIIITKHGHPIARISPPGMDDAAKQKQAVQNMREFMQKQREDMTPGKISFEEALAWRHAGHTY